MATFVPASSRSDSEEELAARSENTGLFVSCAPAFRRPLAVGIGIVTVFACTAAALLAAGHAYRNSFGTVPKQVMTATTAIQDLDELLEAVEDDFNGGILGQGLEDFLSADEDDDASNLLDEEAEEDPSSLLDEAHEDAFPRGLQQKWGQTAAQPHPWQAARKPTQQKWGQTAENTHPWQAAHRPTLGRRIEQLFKAADKDHSGFIEVSELTGAAGMAHERLGMHVTKQELAAEVNGILNDGRLGPKEFNHALVRLLLFKRLDQDGNGRVQGHELEALKGLLKKRFGVTFAAFHHLSTKAGAGPAGQIGPAVLERVLAEAEAAYVPPGIMHFFKSVDKDADGTIKGEELHFVKNNLQKKFSLSEEKYQQLLHSVDSDHDSKLTPQELKQMVMSAFSFSSGRAPELKKLPQRLALFFMRCDFNGDGAIAGPKEKGFAAGVIQRKFQMLPPRYNDLVKEADKNGDGKLEPLELQFLVSKARQEEGKKPVKKTPGAAVEVVRPGAPKNLRAPAWQHLTEHHF